MGGARYVYNGALAMKQNDTEKILDWYSIRDLLVTEKDNTWISSWETEIPSDIREGGIRDLKHAYQTAFSNLKNGNIRKFKFKFRTKKNPKQSIELPKTAVSIRNNLLYIFPSYCKEGIKISKDKALNNLEITNYCRLVKERDIWYLAVPVKVKKRKALVQGRCALDPGINNFHTIYSDREVVQVQTRKDILMKLRAKLAQIRSDQATHKKMRKKKGRRRRKRRERFIYTRRGNIVDDTHYKLINYLTKNYNQIWIPKFESQELAKKDLNPTDKDNLNTLKHYRFRTRLADKIKLLTSHELHLCTEEYTSKTCTCCGHIKQNIRGVRVYRCSNCSLVVDRDINGARNIYIKNIP